MGGCVGGGVVYDGGAQSRPSEVPDANQNANQKLAWSRQMLVVAREDAGLSPRTAPQLEAKPHAVQNRQRSVFAEAADAATVRRDRVAVSGPRMSAERTGSEGSQQFRTVKQNLKHATDAITHVRTISTVSTNRAADEKRVFNEEGKWAVEDATQMNPNLTEEQKNDIFVRAGNNAIFANFNTLRDIQGDAERTAAAHKIRMEDGQDSEVDAEGVRAMQTHATARTYEDLAAYQPADTLPSNCIDKVAIAFHFLAQMEGNPHLDHVKLDNTGYAGVTNTVAAITNDAVWLPTGPDHYLLVIGRDPERTDPTDPTTWGDSTIICDPWSGRSFAAPIFGEEMTLLRSTTAGATRTELLHSHTANTPYNPNL